MSVKSTAERSQGDKVGICAFYIASSCRKGRKCNFLHHIPEGLSITESKSSKQGDLCYFFLKGKCNDGVECRRLHNEPPSFNGTIRKVCTYITQGGCNRGKLCSYIHDLPVNFLPVNVVNPYLSNVPQVVINASDNVLSMSTVPKLCRFYKRGMCFFGDNCTNFHDKPAKDVEAFLSDLRKDEALKESHDINSLNENGENSNNLSTVLAENENPDISSLNASQYDPKSSYKKISIREESSSFELNELPNDFNNENTAFNGKLRSPSFDVSTMAPLMAEASCSNSRKSHEPVSHLKSNGPVKSKNSSKYSLYNSTHIALRVTELSNESSNLQKSDEFVRTVNYSSKECQTEELDNLSSTSSTKLKEFGVAVNTCPDASEQAIAGYNPEFTNEPNCSSKSKDFKNAHYSNASKALCGSSKSREFFNSKLYPKSSISSGFNCRTNSRQFFNSSYSSKHRNYSRFRCSNNLESRELGENADRFSNSEKEPENKESSLRSRNWFETKNGTESEELLGGSSNSNGLNCNSNLSEKQSLETSNSNRRNGTRLNCSMTRKQSKSQRKLSRKRTRSPLNYRKHF